MRQRSSSQAAGALCLATAFIAGVGLPLVGGAAEAVQAPAGTTSQETGVAETSPPEQSAPSESQSNVEGVSDSDGDGPLPPTFISQLAGELGDVYGDIFFWGQRLRITGRVLDNAFVGGMVASLDGGTVEGDLFAFGTGVTVDGEVFGDVYAFAQQLTITERARIHGNVIVFVGALTIDGSVGGLVTGGGGALRINGLVGSIDLDCGLIEVGPEARILGDLEYTSNEEADIDQGASIGGEVRWNREEDEDEDEDEENSSDWIAFGILWQAWGYLSKLVVGVVALVLGGAAARAPAAALRRHPARGLGFGFVAAVVVPVACVVAMLLVVGLPLGAIGLGFYAIAVYLARLVTAHWIGDWLLRRVSKRAPSEYLALALGLLLLLLAMRVPYLGFLVHMTAIVAGIGGIFLTGRGYFTGGGPGTGGDAGAALDASAEAA